MDTIICLFVNSLVRNFIVLPVISQFFQPPARYWDEGKVAGLVLCIFNATAQACNFSLGLVGAGFRLGEGNMQGSGSGQTSDLSSVSWWGCGGAGTMGGQRAPNCCILPQPPCNARECRATAASLQCIAPSVPAVSGAAPNPLMPMGAHHHPGVQYAPLDTPN